MVDDASGSTGRVHVAMLCTKLESCSKDSETSQLSRTQLPDLNATCTEKQLCKAEPRRFLLIAVILDIGPSGSRACYSADF